MVNWKQYTRDDGVKKKYGFEVGETVVLNTEVRVEYGGPVLPVGTKVVIIAISPKTMVRKPILASQKHTQDTKEFFYNALTEGGLRIRADFVTIRKLKNGEEPIKESEE